MKTILSVIAEAQTIGITIPQYNPNATANELDILADALQRVVSELRLYANWQNEANKVSEIYFSRRTLHIRVCPGSTVRLKLIAAKEPYEATAEANEHGWVAIDFPSHHRVNDACISLAVENTKLVKGSFSRDYTVKNVYGYSDFPRIG